MTKTRATTATRSITGDDVRDAELLADEALRQDEAMIAELEYEAYLVRRLQRQERTARGRASKSR
jgi:hypothetical protein